MSTSTHALDALLAEMLGATLLEVEDPAPAGGSPAAGSGMPSAA